MTTLGGAFEKRLAHLRATRVVEGDEEGVGHQPEEMRATREEITRRVGELIAELDG